MRTMRLLAPVLLAAGLVSACTSQPEPSAAFCGRLKLSTGPAGAETLFSQHDPQRLQETTQELRDLLALAPDTIEPTMQGLVDLFEEVELADAKDLPTLLIRNERTTRELSGALTDYAVVECGLFLQRAPVPTATSAPLLLTE